LFRINYVFNIVLCRLVEVNFNLLDVIYTYTDLCGIKFGIDVIIT